MEKGGCFASYLSVKIICSKGDVCKMNVYVTLIKRGGQIQYRKRTTVIVNILGRKNVPSLKKSPKCPSFVTSQKILRPVLEFLRLRYIWTVLPQLDHFLRSIYSTFTVPFTKIKDATGVAGGSVILLKKQKQKKKTIVSAYICKKKTLQERYLGRVCVRCFAVSMTTIGNNFTLL